MGEEGGAETRAALSVRRPLTICTRGADSPRAAASIFRSSPRCRGLMGCTSPGVSGCVRGGPGARGRDRRPGGWPAFSPRASATPRATHRWARGSLPLTLPPGLPFFPPHGLGPRHGFPQAARPLAVESQSVRFPALPLLRAVVGPGPSAVRGLHRAQRGVVHLSRKLKPADSRS